MTKTFCNKCGIEINEKSTYKKFKICIKMAFGYELLYRPCADLCKECGKEIFKFMK